MPIPFASHGTDCPDQALWDHLLDGALSQAKEAELLEHLQSCPDCTLALENESRRWHDSKPLGREYQAQRGLDADLLAQRIPRPPANLISPAPSPFRGLPAGSLAMEIPQIDGLTDFVEVGQGGMGTVYRAHDLDSNRPVAVKILTRAGRFNPTAYSRALQEGLTVSRLAHPNIVSIFRSGVAEGLPYLVMEWLSGGTLQQKIDRGLPDPVESARIMRDLADAVNLAHTQSVIHRDLKPANVMLQPTGEPGGRSIPKLVDFGLSRPETGGQGLTESGVVLGTPGYMAPEQTGVAGTQRLIGPATDIHGLGAILYALLTGHAPYQGKTIWESLMMASRGEYTPVRSVSRKLPADLYTIVEKCLQPEPGRRYRAAAELVDELDRYLSGQPILARPISMPERLARWARRRPAAAASTVLITLSGMGALAGTGYHLHTQSLALAKLTQAQQETTLALKQTKAALEDSRQSRDYTLKTLSAFQGQVVERLLKRGKALDPDNREFLQNIRELYDRWPLEPDPLEARMFRANGLRRLALIFSQLNQTTDVEACERAAQAELDEALKLDPSNIQIRAGKVQSLLGMQANLQQLGKYEQLEKVAHQLIPELRVLIREAPDHQSFLPATLVSLSISLVERDRPDEALPLLGEAVELVEKELALSPNNEQAYFLSCAALPDIGLCYRRAHQPAKEQAVLWRLSGLTDEGIVRFATGRLNFQDLQGRALVQLAESLMHLGIPESPISNDDQKTARELLLKAQDVYTFTSRNYPKDSKLGERLDALVRVSCWLYELSKAQGKASDAGPQLKQALDIATEAHQREPAVFERTRSVVSVLQRYADFQDLADHKDLAGECCVQIIQVAEPWQNVESVKGEVNTYLIGALDPLINLRISQNQHEQVAALLEKRIALARPEELPQFYLRLAMAYMLSGDLEHSRKAAETAAGYPRTSKEAEILLNELREKMVTP